MTPFYTRFPALAARETRCLHVLQPGGVLPLGEYGLVELYCEEEDCDCRRVLVQVTAAKEPHTVLATINYGWESAEFYMRWMHGDSEAGHEIAEASLDPLNQQSQYADPLLDLFRQIVQTDSAYVARLARHYEMFKQALRRGAPFAGDAENSQVNEDVPMEEAESIRAGPPGLVPRPDRPVSQPKPGRNDPCPCGSGKKYKKCCGKN